MSHSAEKCKRGPFLIYKHAFCCKITQKQRVTLWDIKKFSKKSRTVPKKINRGRDPLVSAGFVGYVKKVKNERRDPLEREKISKKKSHSAEKPKVGPYIHSRPVLHLTSKIE